MPMMPKVHSSETTDVHYSSYKNFTHFRSSGGLSRNIKFCVHYIKYFVVWRFPF